MITQDKPIMTKPITPKQSIFVSHTILCTVIATLCGAAAVVLTGLSIGLGVGLTPDNSCDKGINCCSTDNECMQNLGYMCTDGICTCNYGSTLNGSAFTCGSVNWECKSSSECRQNLGLDCYANTCTCSYGQYFDRQLDRCTYRKVYGQDCIDDNDCDGDLICNNIYNSCNCPLQSNVYMCDCPYGYYYCGTNRSCSLLKTDMDTCTQSYECDSLNALSCNGTHCVCAAGYYWNPFTNGCSPQMGYNKTCTVLNNFNYNSCDDSIGLKCFQNATVTGTCKCDNAHYYDSSNTICLNKKASGIACIINDECFSSQCISSFCV